MFGWFVLRFFPPALRKDISAICGPGSAEPQRPRETFLLLAGGWRVLLDLPELPAHLWAAVVSCRLFPSAGAVV